MGLGFMCLRSTLHFGPPLPASRQCPRMHILSALATIPFALTLRTSSALATTPSDLTWRTSTLSWIASAPTTRRGMAAMVEKRILKK